MRRNNSSGLKGVTYCEKNNGENKYWKCRVQGRINFQKLFPYTDEGLALAYKTYKKVIEENKERYYNYELRYSNKNI